MENMGTNDKDTREKKRATVFSRRALDTQLEITF